MMRKCYQGILDETWRSRKRKKGSNAIDANPIDSYYGSPLWSKALKVRQGELVQ